VEDGEHKKCGVHKVRREEKNRRKGTGEIVIYHRVSGWEETKKQSLNPGNLTRQPKKRGGKRGARKLPAHFWQLSLAISRVSHHVQVGKRRLVCSSSEKRHCFL